MKVRHSFKQRNQQNVNKPNPTSNNIIKKVTSKLSSTSTQIQTKEIKENFELAYIEHRDASSNIRPRIYKIQEHKHREITLNHVGRDIEKYATSLQPWRNYSY